MVTILVLCLFLAHAWAEGPTVVTAKGPVKGHTSSNGEYTTFFGIPYAKVDESNPFGESVEHPAFKTTYDASDSSIKCPQMGFGKQSQAEGILQCLVLNIYVPKSVNTTHLGPVLVWIHGGLFNFGSGGEFGGKYLVSHDIVVVTINYRLGPYGFLCLNDPRVPGNQGLKDQFNAIKWVKQNIRAFGGNPDDLTIAGESAGAGSVALQLYYPEILFNKAIIQSGSPFVEGMFVKADYDAAMKIAKEMGRKTRNTEDALTFLTESDPKDVLRAFSNLRLELRPCREKHFRRAQNFVKDDPFHLHSNNLEDVKILIGYNNKEEFRMYAQKTEQDFEALEKIVYDKLKKNFNLPSEELNTLSRIIHRFYFGSKPVTKKTMLEVVDFASDFIMNKAAEMSVNKFLEHGNNNLYKYIFSYVGNQYANVTGAGASHGEELNYIFEIEPRHKFERSDSTENALIRERMTTMWANFVKYGNPTPSKTELLPVTWTPVSRTSDARPYLNIDAKMEMLEDVYHDRISFWELFYKNYWINSVLVNRKH